MMPRQAWKSDEGGGGGGGGGGVEGLRRFFFRPQNFGVNFPDTEYVYHIVHHQPLWQAQQKGIQGGWGGGGLNPHNPPAYPPDWEQHKVSFLPSIL